MGWFGAVVKDLASKCSPSCHLDVVTFVKFQSPLSIVNTVAMYEAQPNVICNCVDSN